MTRPCSACGGDGKQPDRRAPEGLDHVLAHPTEARDFLRRLADDLPDDDALHLAFVALTRFGRTGPQIEQQREDPETAFTRQALADFRELYEEVEYG
jgi:hypothetical protein